MNKAILMGRLTKDSELRYTSNNNTAVCSFTLAVNRRFAKEGEQKADFISCVSWQKTAEFISKHFAKGDMIAVVGRIQTRTWDDNDGKKHYVTEVVVEEAYFTGSKTKGGEAQVDRQTGTEAPQEGTYDDDDELPF
jgi:single-strand DNA-binding protein